MRVPVRKKLDVYVQQVAVVNVVTTQTNQLPRGQGEKEFPCLRDNSILQNSEAVLQEAFHFWKALHFQKPNDQGGTNCVPGWNKIPQICSLVLFNPFNPCIF